MPVTDASIPAHRAAFEEARQQLALLRDAERSYLAESPYRFVHERDTRGGRYVVRAVAASSAPFDAERLAGEVVRQLRASLDALATSLAAAPTRFPIYESLVLFAQRARKAIAPMPDEAQAYLEELQPYHAIGGFRNGPLWTLRQLSAAESVGLTGMVQRGTIGVNTQRDVALVGEPAVVEGPFTDGAIVASVVMKIVGRDPKLDMYFQPDLALGLASSGRSVAKPAIAALGDLCDHVERVVFGALEPTIASR